MFGLMGQSWVVGQHGTPASTASHVLTEDSNIVTTEDGLRIITEQD